MEPFATEAELSAFTGGRVAEDDPRVAPALDGASAVVRAYCGWHISPRLTETVFLDGPGGTYLGLPTKNLVGITSLVESGVALVPDVDFKWSADGSLRRLRRYWTDDYRDLAVTFTHGFDEAPDIKSVALAIVTRQLASPMGATFEAVGATSVRWAETTRGVSGGVAVLAHEYALLDPYRIETI